MKPPYQRSSRLLLALAVFVPASWSPGAQPLPATFADLPSDKALQVSEATGSEDSTPTPKQAPTAPESPPANGSQAHGSERVPPGPVSETVDPALVGTWELGFPDTQGAWKWVFRIEADGRYSLTTEGVGQLAGHSGLFRGADGRWSLRSTQGMAWSDGGTYSFPEGPDGETLLLVGESDPAVWTRR